MPVVQFSDAAEHALRLADLLQKLRMASGEAGFFLRLPKDRFRAEQCVPHSLAADAAVLRDLRKGEVFIVIKIREFPLLLCEKVSVEIQQEGEIHGLFHDCPSHAVK